MHYLRLFLIMTGLAIGFSETAMPLDNPTSSGIAIARFQPIKPLTRATRPANLEAVIENHTDAAMEVTVQLSLPDGIRLIEGPQQQTAAIEDVSDIAITWSIESADAGPKAFSLEVLHQNTSKATANLTIDFLPALDQKPLDYIPAPEPVQTEVLIGAHHCPLWEADKPEMWSQLRIHPERTPALGFYAQENPEISDWETKWAVDHGVSFFIYCWYRASQGGPVQTRFSSAIHDGLFKSRYKDAMKFTIMWENQSRGVAGVANQDDLMNNLLPFWIDTYFKDPSYLKIDNKPLLFIYRPEFLIDDLGGPQNVVTAFNLMREACKQQGFDGLYLLGEYRGLDPKHLTLMRDLGLDYSFAYCWYVPDSPAPRKAIDTQLSYIQQTQTLGILPQIVTVSQGWSGWRDEGSIWTIPPDAYTDLLREAKALIASFPAQGLSHKMLLLDNWNEWGEGHFIAPYRQYGFGYLDAVRNVFAPSAGPHQDLIPEDIGLGPYDTAYQSIEARKREDRQATRAKAQKTGPVTDGLVAWWAFDETDPASPYALDYTGHRLGGRLHNTHRAPGFDGNALVCDGGCVTIEDSPLLDVTGALTLACWVKTGTPGQDDVWLMNRIFGGITNTGFRLGLSAGKLCFAAPQTDWSHHLTANAPMPVDVWVHVAATFDGQRLRLYMNGEEQAALDRPGPLHTNTHYLCIGSFDVDHRAHFTGLMDEVRFYGRALSPDELRTLATPPVTSLP